MGHKKPTLPLNSPITPCNPLLLLIICTGQSFCVLLPIVTRLDHIEVNGVIQWSEVKIGHLAPGPLHIHDLHKVSQFKLYVLDLHKISYLMSTERKLKSIDRDMGLLYEVYSI